MKRQVTSVRDYFSDRRREVVRELRTKNGPNKGAMLAIKKIYDRVLDELTQIEQMYEECLVRLNVELSVEARDRLQSSSYVTTGGPRIGRVYREPFERCETFEEILEPKCIWTSTPEWCLQDTIDILNESKIEIPIESDETDLTFKQEMAILRAKMFSAQKETIKLRLNEDVRKTSSDTYVEETWKDLVQTLKFVDGEFTACENWSKALDACGMQLRSKWLLVFCPQVGRIMKKRRIHILHLNPLATFDFLSSIRQNGFDFLLTRKHLLTLLEDFAAEAPWLINWTMQLRTIQGRDIAATLIQALWRGYRLRQRIRESERRYVAASVLWFVWISLLKTRQMQQRYLDKIQTSLRATRQLSSIFANDFGRFVAASHVVLHLPSLGHPTEMRRTIEPRAFAVRQNVMCLKVSFVRNPCTEVIYVLPVPPSEDLLSMYRDIVDSIDPKGAAAKRITYVTLSEAKTFERRSMNVTRILHCSEATLQNVRRRIARRPAYILPWIVDDCDVRLADHDLGLPMMGPDLEIQRELLNPCRVSEIFEDLDLRQPAHARHVRDYGAMCDTLAELIAINTEICRWHIRLNYGGQTGSYGAFLINHISVPFMPVLRRERAKYGDEWRTDAALRAEFLDALVDQLPKVVFRVTRLLGYYVSWKDFYAHVQKYGCLLQAVPDEKNATTVTVSLFVPGHATGNEPKWIGTADKIYFDASLMTYAYMLPQTSIDNFHFESEVNKFARAMQVRGYFGYLTIDCYCYPHKYEENVIVLMLDVHPYYCLVQQYVDWVKFAIGGRYSKATNTLNADVAVSSQIRRGKSSYALSPPKWDETNERYAIAIPQIHHERFAAFSWSRLKILIEDCDILFDATTKEGSHLILHESEMRNSAMFIVISSSMNTTLTMTHSNLAKLHDALRTKPTEKHDTNIQEIANFFINLSLKYRDVSTDQCT